MDVHLVGALAGLLAVAAGAGHLVRSAAGGSDTAPLTSWAVTVLVGLGLEAAVLSNLGALGVPRPCVLGIGFAIGGVGLLLLLVRDRARFARFVPREAFVAALAALALLAPLILACQLPVLAHDTLFIWLPKMEEVAAGRMPELVTADPLHAHAEYPRGLAWLVSLAWPGTAPDAQLVKLVPWVIAWLTAPAIAAFAGSRGAPMVGAATALLFACCPDVAQASHTGYADLPLAAMLLLAGIGLTVRAEAPAGSLVAAVGAIGAASIKEEGALVAVAVALACGHDVVVRPERRRAALAGLLSFAVVVPWWWLRAGAPGGVLATVGHFLAGPELLALRVAEVARDLGVFLVDPGALIQPGETAEPLPIVWAAWIVLVAVLVLLPRGPRAVVAWPAGLLLLVDVAIYVVTPSQVRWHIRTSFGRLLLQVMPLMLVAASLRLAAGGTGVRRPPQPPPAPGSTQ